MLFRLASILSVSLLTAALPFGIIGAGSDGPLGSLTGCPVSDATLTFPEGQTALSIPAGQVPNHILLGKGVQNYTCSDAGKYTYAPGLNFNKSLMHLSYRSAGAVAKLYDISCLFGTPRFDTIQDVIFAVSPIMQQVRWLPSDPRTHAVSDYSPNSTTQQRPPPLSTITSS